MAPLWLFAVVDPAAMAGMVAMPPSGWRQPTGEYYGNPVSPRRPVTIAQLADACSGT